MSTISTQSVQITWPTTQFVNRKQEINLIESLLKKVRRGIYFSDWIVGFYGIHAIGKTTLLNEIFRICQQDNLSCIKNDFDSTKSKSLLPEQIITRISKKLQSWQPDLVSRTLDQLPGLPTEQEWLSVNGEAVISNLPQKTSHLAGLIHVFLQKQPLILLFDTIEQASEAHLEWLESFFSLLTFERRTRLIIIVAGRKDVRWTRFEVRSHSESWKLLPFDVDGTGHQLLSLHEEYVGFAKNLYHLTAGHPLSNRLVIDYLLSLQKFGIMIHPCIFKKYHHELIQALIDGFIDQVAMKSIRDDRLKEAIQLLAPLRRFDMDLLLQFIDHFSLPYGEGFGVLLLRREMMKSRLVTYDEHMLAVDVTVRRILALSMRHSAPERYRKVHEFALRSNIRRWQEFSRTDRHSKPVREAAHSARFALLTAEMLYYRANLLALDGMPCQEVALQLTDDLLELGSEMTLVDAQQLQAELEQDWELEELLAEGFHFFINALDKIVKRKQNSKTMFMTNYY